MTDAKEKFRLYQEGLKDRDLTDIAKPLSEPKPRSLVATLGLPKTIALTLAAGAVLGTLFGWTLSVALPVQSEPVVVAAGGDISPQQGTVLADIRPFTPQDVFPQDIAPAPITPIDLGSATIIEAAAEPEVPTEVISSFMANGPVQVASVEAPDEAIDLEGLRDVPTVQETSAPARTQVEAALQDIPQAQLVVATDWGQGAIALIIDDVGLNSNRTKEFATLPGQLTLSFLPYAPNLEKQISVVRRAGHRIMAHLPMEPEGDSDPGPNALMIFHGRTELSGLIETNLAPFKDLVAINNHMGSKMTANRMSMSWVMEALRSRDILFVDSLTTGSTQAHLAAKENGVRYIRRDLFLDPEQGNRDGTLKEMARRTERLAREKGHAIVIGHPYPETLALLQTWIPEMQAKGFVFVDIMQVANGKPGRTQLAQK